MAQLSDEAKAQIELEVRRILSSDDTSLRKVWASEARDYRDFLQSQFKWITIGVSALATVGVALFVWFFSDSVSQTQQEIREKVDQAKQEMASTIDSKVIDYRILQDLKSRVSDMVEIEVNNQAEKTTTEIIAPKITQLATQTVGDIAEKKIEDAIVAQVKKIQSSDVEQLLQRATTPSGAVVAFVQSCPNGWTSFPAAIGRTIIGAGEAAGSTSRAIQEQGGADFHTLSVDELPPHSVEIPSLVGLSGVDRYNAGGRDYPVVGKVSGTVQIGGSGRSFSTMPPYIALAYCKKD